MKNKTVFVSAEGLAWGLLLLVAWPVIQAAAPEWNGLYVWLSYATGLAFYAFGTVAADGAVNSRNGQWIVLVIGVLYGISNIGAYNPMALLSVGPTIWGAYIALRDGKTNKPLRLHNQQRVLLAGVLGLLVAFIVAAKVYPYGIIQPSGWLNAIAVIVVLLQHIAIIAYLIGDIKGDSPLFRYAKAFGAVLALVQNLAYHSPGSVAYQVALLTIMLLLATDDHFRKNQNPPSSS